MVWPSKSASVAEPQALEQDEHAEIAGTFASFDVDVWRGRMLRAAVGDHLDARFVSTAGEG